MERSRSIGTTCADGNGNDRVLLRFSARFLGRGEEGRDRPRPVPRRTASRNPTRHSTDIFFGPTPRGLESNWVPTDPNGRFEVLARFYGPEKPLFDKRWRLGDIERIQSR